MNRSLLFIVFLVCGLKLSAQYSQSPAVTNIFTLPSTEEVVLDVVYTTNSDTNKVYWKFEKASTFDPAWEFYVCDLNLCYSSTTERCPPTKPNVMKVGGNLFQYHFKPHNTNGVSTVTVRFYADKNFTQETHSTVININISESVSTKDLNILNNLKVYPNPATDYFQLANATGVKKIIIYNMFGKEVKSYFHYSNAQHEISELKTGMYIVKLLNDKNKVIKSVKLNKSYSGV